jgi:GNAT superfamily N-acetyltransferase
MKIVKANKKDKTQAIQIAKDLKEWFSKEGVKNLSIDFNNNTVIVAKDNNQVIGFICYTTYCGKMLLIWMGVKRDQWRNGIGTKLLEYLTSEAKSLGLYYIETETLPEEVEYEPYKITRSFYYKNGFERVHYKKASIEGWDDQIVLEKKI